MPCAAKITARSTEAAESVDRRTRHPSRPTGSQDAHASNVLTVITVVGPFADDHVLDVRGGQAGALL
jgi:hypothetical protein